MSQGAVVSQTHNPNRNVFNDRLNCPRLSHSRKWRGVSGVPQTWSDSCKTPVAEAVVRATDDALRCVCRMESASTGISGELTVVGQISRCLAGQTLEYQDGNLEVDTLSYW